MILSLTKKEEDDEKVHQDPPVVSTVISNAYRGVALARSPSPWTPGMEVVLSPRSSMSRSCSLAAAENRFCGQTAALPAKETEQENQPTMNGNSPPPKQPIRVWDTTGPAKTDRKEKMEESSATLTEDAVLLQDRLSKPLFRPPNSEHNSTNVSVLSDSTNLPYGEKRGNKLANVTNQSHGPKEQVPSAPPSRIYRM
ncbi:hypothetical protein ADEAN_000804200 [Angomonas deanei]|uniref:Uncharacterized protein n=1 Tax=Angomonas deanei TaxID=59799 RepID=A0A7G2CKY5_9TRYP|nr:hypothetical protein ADEAN_000804200 [Angomonas deanei]